MSLAVVRCVCFLFFFFSSRRRHTRFDCDWSSDVCSSDLALTLNAERQSEVLQAQLCAQNELVRMRLSRQMPPVGDNSLTCEQGGRQLQVQIGRASCRERV